MTAGLVSLIVFIGYWGYAVIKERPMYRARARVQINTPPILLTASQGSQWISVTQMDPKTWVNLVPSRQIRTMSYDALLAKQEDNAKKGLPKLDVQADWFNNISASIDPDGQLAWVEAIAPTADIAAAVANVVAEQLENY